MHHSPNYPHVNKDGKHLSHWFGDKRHYVPWYDSNADYNTNSKSYYDFLGFRIRQLDLMTEKVNALLDEDIRFDDSHLKAKDSELENLISEVRTIANSNKHDISQLTSEVNHLKNQFESMQSTLNSLEKRVK